MERGFSHKTWNAKENKKIKIIINKEWKVTLNKKMKERNRLLQDKLSSRRIEIVKLHSYRIKIIYFFSKYHLWIKVLYINQSKKWNYFLFKILLLIIK
jgi:hypothetical protein